MAGGGDRSVTWNPGNDALVSTSSSGVVSYRAKRKRPNRDVYQLSTQSLAGFIRLPPFAPCVHISAAGFRPRAPRVNNLVFLFLTERVKSLPLDPHERQSSPALSRLPKGKINPDRSLCLLDVLPRIQRLHTEFVIDAAGKVSANVLFG